jgi:pre-mRNA-splicing factor CWC22
MSAESGGGGGQAVDESKTPAGGRYVPPMKLAMMQREAAKDKSTEEYQRLAWEALKKSINGIVNKVNASNLTAVLPELFSENLVRGRGLLARSVMKAQMASPQFSNVFAALVAVVNAKFPEIGELVLKRCVLQFKRALRRNDKPVCSAQAKFIAQLVNQQVVHELLSLEIVTLLLQKPTLENVEVAIEFLRHCGYTLGEVAPQGLHGAFERLRNILHEGDISKRGQFLIEGLFALRKKNFEGYQGVPTELDLVDENDQVVHEISLQDEGIDAQPHLDVFSYDPNFEENEKKYEKIKKEILGEDDEENEEVDGDGYVDNNDAEDEDDAEEDQQQQQQQQQHVQDMTDTNRVNLRRTIYLTVVSSLDFEEAGHKLMKMNLPPGQEMELCTMIVECCAQERTYLRFYGLLGARFCFLNKAYQNCFDECFMRQYATIHRLETNKMRNVAKFFAHLMCQDALPWSALSYISLTEEDTTSSSRIFIKILFQEMSEQLGVKQLSQKLQEQEVSDYTHGVLPSDTPKHTRFAINFFTQIGLGALTDGLRATLKQLAQKQQEQAKIRAQQEAERPEPQSKETSRRNEEKDESRRSSDDYSESESRSDESYSSTGEDEKESDMRYRRKKHSNGRKGREDEEEVEHESGMERSRSRGKRPDSDDRSVEREGNPPGDEQHKRQRRRGSKGKDQRGNAKDKGRGRQSQRSRSPSAEKQVSKGGEAEERSNRKRRRRADESE